MDRDSGAFLFSALLSHVGFVRRLMASWCKKAAIASGVTTTFEGRKQAGRWKFIL